MNINYVNSESNKTEVLARTWKRKNNNNNMNNGDLHKVVLNRSVLTFIKGEVENIFVREYHCNLDDWSRSPWFVDFEQILELISRGIWHDILFLQMSYAFYWDCKIKAQNPKRILETKLRPLWDIFHLKISTLLIFYGFVIFVLRKSEKGFAFMDRLAVIRRWQCYKNRYNCFTTWK